MNEKEEIREIIKRIKSFAIFCFSGVIFSVLVILEAFGFRLIDFSEMMIMLLLATISYFVVVGIFVICFPIDKKKRELKSGD